MITVLQPVLGQSSPNHRGCWRSWDKSNGCVKSHFNAKSWWNGTDESQAYSRCWRLGQEKTVHVWVLRAVNCLVDDLVDNTNRRKVTADQEIVACVRRLDSKPPLIPKQSKHGIREMRRG